MFAGIIETRAEILSVEMRGKCRHIVIRKPNGWKLTVGESVSIDGICSTIIAHPGKRFEVEYMPETLAKTTAIAFAPGHVVNLERSLRYGDRIHGHLVAGHVDAYGKILHIEKHGRSCIVSIPKPRKISRYIVEKGSVAVNGVSLTVAHASTRSFDVALIPHTLAKTNLGLLTAGDAVNIECDMLARYGLAGINRGATVRVHAKKRVRKKAQKPRRVKT